MLPYAWRCLNTRPALGGAALVLALLAAVPGALAATVLAPAVVAFVVSGDALLAVSLLPGPLAVPGASPAAWAALGVTLAAAVVVWARVYALVVWASDDARAGGAAGAWAGTRRSWRTVAALHAQAYAALGALTVAGLAATGALGGPAGGAAARALLVVGVALAARAAARVV
ncbi:MAG TPA: hypothetical protein VHJ34_01125, partial [Actinomycetota bacterium]|nr:hypothetical protein [Actinomycetota bacterium]